MANDKTLFEVIENERKAVKKYKPELLEMPEFTSKNLKYDFFEWQKSALENFLIFDRISELDDFPDLKNKPTHLLFNMATGAGKTMMMAALILYYFEKGYRHFLFFVNQNNIVDKTENNFIDPTHAKFLFTEKILQGDTVIPIRKVETFSPHSDGIEIKFTSIQKLYNDIHTERENQTTLADLHELNLVMLGDEAHHLNAQTKNKKQGELELEQEINSRTSDAEIERKGWEHMVLELLLNKNGNPSENVLLEFTATLPGNAEVQQKYADKIITKFGLKEFLQKGYTKEINLVSSTLGKAKPQTLSFQVHGNQLLQETQFKVHENDEKARQLGTQTHFTQTINVSEIERHIFNKALHIKGKNSQSLFHFDRLQSKLNIQNRNELQNNLLKDWQIEFLGLRQDKQISPDDKLVGCLKILELVEKHLNESDKPFIGTKEFTPKKLWEIFGMPKQKLVKKDTLKPEIAEQNDWYVMDKFAGTSLEEKLIQFISDHLGDLQAKYNVHLIRNEEVFKLSNFDDGKGFMPDFILLLKDKQTSSSNSNSVEDFLHYQIFIEPKGEHLVENDLWKEAFLEAITVEYGKDKILQKDTPHYRLIGLPFFTDNKKNPKEYGQFTESFPLGSVSPEK